MKGNLIKKVLVAAALSSRLILDNGNFAYAQDQNYEKSRYEKIISFTDNWTKREKYAESAWIGLNLIDWYQTSIGVGEKGGEERNPILGKHPSKSKINNYFALWTIIHPITTYLLPKKANTCRIFWQPRKLWLAASLSISGGAIITNIGKYSAKDSRKNIKINHIYSLGFKKKF